MRSFLLFSLAATVLFAADPVQALFDKSVAALAAGDYSGAEQGFWSVLKARPDNIAAYGNLGVVYTRTHQYTKAIEVYAHGLDVAPAEPGLLLNLGLAYIKQAQYANALPVFGRLVKVSPGNQQARELQATCQLYTGNLYTALESLQTLKSADPRKATVLRLLALTYFRLNQPEKAQAVFMELRSSTAPPGEAELAIGITQYEIGRYAESVDSLRKALRADARLPDARRELGKALMKTGQDAEAEREFSLATMQDHDDGEAFYLLGSMELQEEKLTQASAHLEAARELLPDFWAVYYHLGLLKQKRNQLPEAVAMFERAEQLNPKEAEVHTRLTQARAALK